MRRQRLVVAHHRAGRLLYIPDSWLPLGDWLLAAAARACAQTRFKEVTLPQNKNDAEQCSLDRLGSSSRPGPEGRAASAGQLSNWFVAIARRELPEAATTATQPTRGRTVGGALLKQRFRGPLPRPRRLAHQVAALLAPPACCGAARPLWAATQGRKPQGRWRQCCKRRSASGPPSRSRRRWPAARPRGWWCVAPPQRGSTGPMRRAPCHAPPRARAAHPAVLAAAPPRRGARAPPRADVAGRRRWCC